ncbi:hypothetical protein COLO4_15334 [Corchorus olitorius]|uniref:Uncharacterized protein n=1 Tax=Corchorus olitorius TaxID=93759 RepID=A0A1R3JN86_9ROSI|nr:hypothetical protein COLO4_15334 [Corchorus olitorius]
MASTALEGNRRRPLHHHLIPQSLHQPPSSVPSLRR